MTGTANIRRARVGASRRGFFQPLGFRTMSTTPEYDRWFHDEVHVHREALRSWLRGKFPAVVDLDNLVQETMTRVWRAGATTSVSSPRALLFTTAYHLAVDQFRRQKVVALEPLAGGDELRVDFETPSPADEAARAQEIELLKEAIRSLPTKCRQVMTLRKIYGLSQKEIATQLGISEHTVEAQVGNGMRRCAAYLARFGLP
jgi:RNA polymerase sigma factor (sigma-70 family)